MYTFLYIDLEYINYIIVKNVDYNSQSDLKTVYDIVSKKIGQLGEYYIYNKDVILPLTKNQEILQIPDINSTEQGIKINEFIGKIKEIKGTDNRHFDPLPI